MTLIDIYENIYMPTSLHDSHDIHETVDMPSSLWDSH